MRTITLLLALSWLAPAQILMPIAGGGVPAAASASAPSYVNEGCAVYVGNVSDVSCTATTTTAGRTLVAFLAWSAGTITSTTDTGGGTATLLVSKQSWSEGFTSAYIIPNAAAGGHTLNFHWAATTGGGAQLVVVAYAGASATTPSDGTPPNIVAGTFGTTPNCPTYTTANNNVTLLSMWVTNTATVETAPTGFTARQSHGAYWPRVADNGPSEHSGIATSGTATTPQWGNTNGGWACAVVGLKP